MVKKFFYNVIVKSEIAIVVVFIKYSNGCYQRAILFMHQKFTL